MIEDVHNECLKQQAVISEILVRLNDLGSVITENVGTISSSQDAATLQNQMKALREELKANASLIEKNIQEADRLCTEGADMLTPEQFHALKERRNQLETTYLQLLQHSDTLLESLNELTKLLLGFTDDMSSFHSYITEKTREVGVIKAESGNLELLEDSFQRAELLEENVLSNSVRLKDLSALLNRIRTVLDEYVVELHLQCPNVEMTLLDAPELTSSLNRLQSDYDVLMRNCAELKTFLDRLRNVSDAHSQNVDSFGSDISKIESQLSRVKDDVASADILSDNLLASKILSQLEELQTLSFEQAGFLDTLSKSAAALDSALVGTDARERVMLENKQLLDDFRRRHSRTRENIEENVDAWRSKIARSEGLRKGIESLLDWLKTESDRLKQAPQLPLSLDKLSELQHEGQLAHRELISRQKVLDNFGKEIFQNMEMSSGTPNSQLVEQYRKVENVFVPLVTVSKAFCENIADVRSMLSAMNDGEKSLKDKLSVLEKRLENTSPTDTVGLNSVSLELNELVDKDWKDLQKQQKRILTMPNVVETNELSRTMDVIQNDIEDIFNKLETVLNQGENLSILKKEFEGKRNDINSWLNDFREKIDELKQIPLDELQLSNYRDICEQLQNRHREYRSELDAFRSLGSELIDQESFARLHAKTQESFEEPQVRLREISALDQQYDSLGTQLKNKSEKIGLTSEKLADWRAAKNVLLHWAIQESRRLDAECPVALNSNEIAANLAKVSRLEKLTQKEKRPLLEDVKAKARSLLIDVSNIGTEEIACAQKDLEMAWDGLNNNIDLVKQQAVASEELLLGCEKLDKWLKQKELMLNSIEEVVNVDPKVIAGQVFQIELLSSEMNDQENVRNTLNGLAHELVNNSDASIRQQIVEKMDDLNRKWLSLSNKLKEDEDKLSKAKEASIQFNALQRDIKLVLSDIAEDVEEASQCPLTEAKHFDEHLQKLDLLEEKSSNINKKVEELGNIANLINMIINGVQNDVTEQLIGTAKVANELSKKIESLKNATINAKKLESETAKDAENTLKWLKGVKSQLNDIGNISAYPHVLTNQTKVMEELYADVLSKEGDVALLRAKLNEQLRKAPNAQLKTLVDSLYAEWVPVLEETKSKRATIEHVTNLVKQLEYSLDSFSKRAELSREHMKNLNLNDANVAKDLEKQVERSLVDLQALEPSMAKLEDVTGKSASVLRRRLENAHNDWKAIVKDVRNASSKLQNKKELKNRFDKCKLEAVALLNSGRELSPCLADGQENGTTTNGLLTNKETLQKAISDLRNGWQIQNKELNGTLKELQTMLETGEDAEMKQAISDLQADYETLINQLEKEVLKLSDKEKEADRLKREVVEFGEGVRASAMTLPPISLKTSELKQQELECVQLLDALAKKEGDLQSLTDELKSQCDVGIITPTQMTLALNQISNIKDDIDSQKKGLSQRKRKIAEMQQFVSDVEREVQSVCAEVDGMLSEEILQGRIIPDLNELRNQQEELRLFREKLRRKVGDRMEKVTADCDRLIKSADKQADVSEIELQKSKLTGAWDGISNCLAEREKQVCASIQEFGSYIDAYTSLLNWLEDTEESLNNQQLPSTEYKVVKAQSSANDILLKHIEEKQPSVESFNALIDKVKAPIADESKLKSLNEKSEDIAERYSALLERAQIRRAQLHSALELAEEWSQLAGPFSMWLDETEKSVRQLGKLPVDEEVMQQQINCYQELQKTIEAKRQDFERLIDLCPQLSKLTSDKEAAELENFMHTLTSKYQNLESRVDQCGMLLQQLAEDIGNFLDRTRVLSDWLDRMENDIDKIYDISIYFEELIDQSSALTELAMEVTDQEAVVATVVKDGLALCRHTSGDEAVVLHSRIEGLRTRYLELAAITDSKIALLSEALPLAERFQDGCEGVQQYMDAVEQDMQEIDQVPLEAQSALVAQIEDDMSKWRADVDEINSISKQLQQLTRGSRADELDAQTDDLNRRFSTLAEQVTQKAEKLSSAERQSRQVLDELDYLNGWFADAADRLKQASAPAVDPDYVKKQLKNQKLMNEDIAVMRARLRDAAADAQKVSRSLGDEGDVQNALLGSKIEAGRELSAEVTQLGEKRLGELEQALALCQEVEQSFGELHGWLESIENEIENFPNVSTSIQRDELLKQQTLNTELQQAIQSQKPLLDRFEKNVIALGELCDAEDAVKLEKIAEGLEERYEEVSNAIGKRALALDNAIEHSSQFTDRLDFILAKLGGAAAQIRNADPVSADPERICSQILDNMALKEELKLKENVLQSVKESADVILKQAKSNDPAVAEIGSKIGKLDLLWKELNDGAEERGNVLESTLIKAEKFWSELEKCQNAIEELRLRIVDIQPASGQPAVIEKQRNTLLAIENNLHETEPMVNELRLAGQDLCDAVAVEERTHVEQQLGVVEENWSTVTDLYARKNTDLIDAMEKAMDFHGLYAELMDWFVGIEGKMAEFDRLPAPSSADVKNELAALDVLKTILDEKVVQKERLNQLCANLCAGATVQQSAAIQAPINDLNNRWNRLYATLNDRQQKMEKALLEMGQFSQAYDQLMGWIDRTSKTLEEINPRPSNLKQVEIEICKYKVVQNDVRAYEASVETLNNAAKRMIAADPNSASVTQPLIDDLNTQWHTLAEKLDNIWSQLTGAREAAESLGGEMDKWALWLQDKDADLSHSKPLAGLPETAQTQLDDFLVLKAEIEQNRSELEAHLEVGHNYLSDSAGNKDGWIAQRQTQLRKKWTQVQEKLVDKEQKLRIALADAEQLSDAMNAMNDWLANAEVKLGRLEPISRIPSTLQKQIADHAELETEVAVQRDLMADLKSKGTKLQYLCEKKDAIPIKNNLVSARHRLDKIVSRCADRNKQMEDAARDADLYFNVYDELMEWLTKSLKKIEESSADTLFGTNIREALSCHKDFQRDLASHQPMFDTTYKRGKTLIDHAPKNEQASINDTNEDLREKWAQLCTASVQRQRDIEEALLESGQFDDALSSLKEWLEKTLPDVEVHSGDPVHGDFETVNRFVENNQALKDEIGSRQASLNSVRQRAEQMLSAKKDSYTSTEGLREKLNQLNEDWKRLEVLVDQKGVGLSKALREAETFGNEARAILDWLPRIEDRLRMKACFILIFRIGQKPETEAEILDQMDEVAQIRKEFDDELPRLDSILTSGREILSKCHPDAEQNMKYYLKILQARWDEISQKADGKRDDLEKQLSDLHELDELIAKLIRFITAKDEDLKNLSAIELPHDIHEIRKLIEEHEKFDDSLREKQNDVSTATMGRRSPTADAAEKTKAKKPVLKKEKPIRHPKADLLSEKWNRLWLNSVEYGSRLRKMRDYLEELKKLESFTFEEWKERYLNWTDSGKARISDLFRRIDKSGTGRVSRNAFIDEILRSKFPTTRLEMEKVADEFDKGDGMIDSKEFMARLRSDFARRLPVEHKSEGEKINEEVQRQSEKCSCNTPYKIQKVGEGHYRFGDTQIKRMVRILRSTVMVRVGGGWVALDEFLHKHDPCRAKGRTNIDLQHGFYNDVRPINARDSMETFTKSRSGSNSASPVTVTGDLGHYNRYAATPGPITKIREKTERSFPMHSGRRTPSTSQVSLNEGSLLPRRTSDASIPFMEGLDGKSSRSGLISNASRSSSRGDICDIVRPSSRCSESSDFSERPSRIPSLRGRKGVNYRPSSARNSPHL